MHKLEAQPRTTSARVEKIKHVFEYTSPNGMSKIFRRDERMTMEYGRQNTEMAQYTWQYETLPVIGHEQWEKIGRKRAGSSTIKVSGSYWITPFTRRGGGDRDVRSTGRHTLCCGRVCSTATRRRPSGDSRSTHAAQATRGVRTARRCRHHCLKRCPKSGRHGDGRALRRRDAHTQQQPAW